jgi:hypothetical protein
LPINDSFEDREGHQAPFTLREREENVERRTANAERPVAELLPNSVFDVRRSTFGV